MDEHELMTELYLIGLLERVQAELQHCRTFVTSKERIHPVGRKMYDELSDEVSRAVQAYRNGKWRLHALNESAYMQQED